MLLPDGALAMHPPVVHASRGGTKMCDADAREVADSSVLGARVDATPIRGRARSRARRNCSRSTGGAAPATAISWRAHLRAMASLVRDVEVLATGADAAALANPDAKPALDRLVPTFKGERGVQAFSAIDALWRRSTATRASKSWPTGWCCSYERAESGPASSPSS